MILFFGKNITPDIRKCIIKHKNIVKYVFGNRVKFKSSDDCYKFMVLLDKYEYKGIIKDDYDYTVSIYSFDVMKFTALV